MIACVGEFVSLSLEFEKETFILQDLSQQKRQKLEGLRRQEQSFSIYILLLEANGHVCCLNNFSVVIFNCCTFFCFFAQT